jgi:hypothetical protein
MNMNNEATTRIRAVRVSLAATLTRPAGRRRQWTAELGETPSWTATGTTEKAAADALAASVSAFVAEYRPPVVITFAGRAAVVSLDTDGEGAVHWQVEIIRQDGSKMVSNTSAGNWTVAEAYARSWLAHDATDWLDDASVHAAAKFVAGDGLFKGGEYGPEELLRYAAWQRAARHAIDTGVEDFHSWAGEHEREFAVPPASAEGASPA